MLFSEITHIPRLSSSLLNWISTRVVVTGVRLVGGTELYLMRRRARDVRAAQAQTLERLIKHYRRTEVGRMMGFDRLTGEKEFKELPLQQYEDLRPWIELQMEQGGRAAVPEEPSAYYCTSGTTGQPKYIPALKRTLRWNRRTQMLFGYCLLRERKTFLNGSILGIGSPATERYTSKGVPIGSKSGQVSRNLNPLIRAKYVVPPEVFSVDNCLIKYLLMLRLALSRSDITYLQTANTSTIALLADLLNEHWEELLHDLENGGFRHWHDLPAQTQKAVRTRLQPNPFRAADLRALRAAEGGARIRLRHIMPHLQAVGCWISGSCSIFLSRLQEELPPQTLVRELGYVASEMHGTVGIDADGTAAVPLLDQIYYEFLEKGEEKMHNPPVYPLAEIVPGKQYLVLITTFDGLIRYHMNDVVQVNGHFGTAPRLSFVQKGNGLTNITGEKLSEYQVVHAVKQLEHELALCSTFFLMTADPAKMRYTLFYEPAAGSTRLPVEEMSKCLDCFLGALNLEYAGKRTSCRLQPPVVSLLRTGTFQEYRKEWVRRGRLDGQFKMIPLQYQNECAFDFSSFLLRHSADERIFVKTAQS